VSVKRITRTRRFTAAFALAAAACATNLAQTSTPQAVAIKKGAPAKPWAPKILSDGQPDVQGTWTAVYYGMGCLTNPTNGDVNCVPPPGPRPAAGTANAGGPPEPDANGQTLGQRGNGNPPSIVNAQPDGG
jgi:hypothetical protein